MRKYVIIMRCFLVLLSFALCTSLISCTPAKTSTTQDTVPLIASDYQGYRLSVTDLSVKKKKKKSTSIHYSLINTGRNNININNANIDNIPILFEFDHSLETTELQNYKDQIISKILKDELSIAAGQTLSKRTMKLNSKDNPEVDDTAFTIVIGDGGSSSKERYYDKKYCPDLHIDSIRIVKLTKKWLTIEYQLSNTGKGPASLAGDTDEENDNLFVRAHLSGAKRLSRGAVAVGGAYVNDRDVLEVGETYTGIFRIDIKKRTRYTSILILELDPYSSVRECDETNNQQFIMIE